jgi:GABA(A) receptor-associated protein
MSKSICNNFKKKHTFDNRKKESTRIMLKYKDRVPIIIETSAPDKELILDKTKFLVPSDLSVGQFLYVLRLRIKLKPECALYIFFNNQLSTTSETIGSIYKMNKEDDGFLYGTVSLENTFG